MVMERKEKCLLHEAHGLVKMKIYSTDDYKYVGFLDSRQNNVENIESEQVYLSIPSKAKRAFDKKFPFDEIVNSGKFVICSIYPKMGGELKLQSCHKKVQVEVTDQNGINFTAILNPKSWKKAEANVAQFTEWSGVISGKLGKTEQGLEIINAGIQIFEKSRRNHYRKRINRSTTAPISNIT